jgi:hypothetical protein
VKLPLRSDAFDATICIAVLHHLASVGKLCISEESENERRMGLRILREGDGEKDDEGRGIGWSSYSTLLNINGSVIESLETVMGC